MFIDDVPIAPGILRPRVRVFMESRLKLALQAAVDLIDECTAV